MASDWLCVPLSYAVTKNHLQGYQTVEHPLKLRTVIESKGTRVGSLGSNTSSRTSSSISLMTEPALSLALDGTDPLSQFAQQELSDPLSQITTDFQTKFFKTSKKQDHLEEIDIDAPNWNSKRMGILNQFTTSEKLSISTSFLPCGVTIDGSMTETIKVQTVVADKMKFRLEQLDDFGDSAMRHMMDLTQQEYIQRIEQLNHELVQSWHSDQRVKALKIAIQCTKMLADTSVLQFYPSQFVLITDILDIFGKLVYDRLNTKACSDVSGSQTIDSHSTRHSDNARETCLNWFFKIASIRELLPRLYVELSILRCHEFLLPSSDYEQHLRRLTCMIRGIGDPLVATYARCYLVRVGLKVVKSRDYIYDNFMDIISVYHMIFSGSTRSELNRQRLTLPMYLNLYGPAFDFILHALMHRQSVHAEEILTKCREHKNNGPLLLTILRTMKAEFVALNAIDLVQLLNHTNADAGVCKGQLFRALGKCVSQCAPPLEQQAQFLNAALHMIGTLTDPAEFIAAAETWPQFIADNFTVHEVNGFLGQIITRMSIGKAYEKHDLPLQTILDKILQHSKDIEIIIVQENFLPFIDLFKKESTKMAVCKNVLENFNRKGRENTADAIVTNALLYIGKILNDNVSALTVEDERRQIAQLINGFLHKVSYGDDLNQQLSFYMEARGAFANLDAVYISLVHAVNKLAIVAHTAIDASDQKQKSGKTPAFARACIAYCFITIPSISSVQVQMDLYLLTGQVALINLCLGQADSCFAAALQLVSELPSSVEVEGKMRSLDNYLVSYMSNMLATLVVVPDSPEQGVLYLFRLALDVLDKYSFEPQSAGAAKVLLHALDMLYVQSLEQFPNNIPGVSSNDELYGHDRKFLGEVNNMCSQVVEKILCELKLLGTANQLRAQAHCALELFLRIVRYADLTREKMFSLAFNLWSLAVKDSAQIEMKTVLSASTVVEHVYNDIKDYYPERTQSLALLLDRMNAKFNLNHSNRI